MVDQGGAGLRPQAGDHIEHAVRKAGFNGEGSEFQRRHRSKFTRLDHHGATSCDGGSALPCHEQQGRVPGRQRGHYAHRLMPGEGHEVGLVDRHHRAFNLVGQPAEVAPPLGVVAHLPAHLGQQFTVVAHLDLGQPVRVLCDQVGQAQHQLAPIGRGHRRPGAGLHGPRGRRDSAVNVARTALRHPGPRLAPVRV